MITEINGSKTLAKYVSFKCECKFDGKKIWFKSKMKER